MLKMKNHREADYHESPWYWNAEDESRWSRYWWWRITSKMKTKNNRKPINKCNSESDTESQ
jgi:hypothetical protein